MKMYYTYPFAYNTPVPGAFTTIRKRVVLQHPNKPKKQKETFTTMRKHAVLQQEFELIYLNKSFTTHGITDYCRILTSSRMKKV